MNSFNVYGQTSETIGGNTPVWLGTVKPVPVGYVLDVEEALLAFPDGHIPAGTPLAPNIDEDEVIVSVIPTKIPVNIINSKFGYLYNDVHIDKSLGANAQATCAVVMHHPEGLLIERVCPELTVEQIAQLQANIPGVLLVRG